jgi:hypothetical protein
VEDREGVPVLPDIDPIHQKKIMSFPSNKVGLQVDHERGFPIDRCVCSVRQTPFPELDMFVNDILATRENIKGSIRSWSIRNGETLSFSIITYHIKDNRWCENIQRSHKSNNIMWNVSIADLTYWQSCFDPDCRLVSFRGKERDLPLGIKEHITEILIAQDVQLSESFERALLDLSVAEGYNRQKDSFNEIDESFDRALLALDLSHDSSNEQGPNCFNETRQAHDLSNGNSNEQVPDCLNIEVAKNSTRRSGQALSSSVEGEEDLAIALTGLILTE